MLTKAQGVITATLFLVTVSINLQMPLYLTYARAAGMGVGVTALVFSAYVVGVLPVLIGLGGVSDRFGRKPVLVAGLCCFLVGTGMTMVFPTMYGLLVTRFLQGIGLGLSVATGTAYLSDLRQEHGLDGARQAAKQVALATSLGFGVGPLSTDIAELIHPSAAPLSYGIVFMLLLACLGSVSRLPSVPTPGGALVRLPHYPRGSIAVGLGIATAWAITGIVITVVPGQLVRYGLAAWSPIALFLVNGVGALAQPLARRLADKTSMRVGYVFMSVGTLLLTWGSWIGNVLLLLAGSAIAGAACYGFTYLGGLAIVSKLGENRRASAVAGYYLFAYVGLGAPSVCVGFLADAVGTVHALIGFAAVVLVASGALGMRK